MLRTLMRSTMVGVLVGVTLAMLPSATPPAQAVNRPPVFSLAWGTLGTGNGEFQTPNGVAFDSAGNVYVVDTNNHRIQKFTADGTYLTQWGSEGAGNGQFQWPYGVAVDSAGNVYVTDTWNHRIQKFTAEGTYLTQWGDLGSGDGQFQWPNGVAVDSAGNVYVVDTNNHRIQKFTADGSYLTQWGSEGAGNGQFYYSYGIAADSVGNVYVADTNNNRIQKFTADGTYLTRWGDFGSGDGQFYSPNGVAVDSVGNVYVADTYNNRIQKFVTPEPAPAVTIAKSAGEREVVAGSPIHYQMTVTNTGDLPLTGVTITDAKAPACDRGPADIASGGSLVVQCAYTTTLADIGTYTNTATVDTNETDAVTSNTVNVQVLEPPPVFVRTWGTTGHQDGQFQHPFGVAVDSAGNVYVTDTWNHRIQKFTADGTYLTQWGSEGAGNGQFQSPYGVAVDSAGDVYVTDTWNHRIQKFTADGTYLTQWGSQGTGDGQFQHPFGVAVDSAGNVYVADTSNHRIQKFTADGTYLTQWGELGVDPGQFLYPAGVAVDSAGNVYVTDPDHERVEMLRIQKFTADGTYLTQWGSEGAGNGQFQLPFGVAVDSAGNVYVTDPWNHRIHKFTATGTHLTQWGDLGSGNGQFAYPQGVAVDSAGNVYVTDTDNNRVQKFTPPAAPAPALAVTTTADETSVPVGTPVHFHVTLENPGNVPLTGVEVTTGPAAGCEGPVADLAVADEVTVDCTLTPTMDDLGTLSRSATADAVEVDPVTSAAVEVEVTVPAGSGVVSGTVTESGSGAPVAGATVALLSPADYSPVAVSTADSAGAFTAVATPGPYLVYVLDTTGAHASGFHGAPSVVTVTVGATATADTALVSVRGTIAGIVTVEGGPLAGALAISVDLQRGQPGAGEVTGVDGSYTIEGVAPGPRLMEFVDLDGAHAMEFFDNATTPAGAAILSVVGAGTVTADAALAAQTAPTGGAHLVGDITSSTGGGDLAGVAVIALRTSDFTVGGGGFTDDNGAYDIEVDPGGYRLAFYDPSASHGFEWFDDQGPNGLADATIVTAVAGTPQTADAALTPTTGTISGTVTDSTTGDPLARAAVFAINTNGAVVGATTTDAAGTWTLTGLRPGAVRLRFLDLTGGRASEYHSNVADYDAATPVTVTAGGAITGIAAALTGGGAG